MSSSSRVLLALTALTFGCADFERGEAAPSSDGGTASTPGKDGGAGGGNNTGGDGGETEPVSFATDAHPLLLSGCQSCHRNGGAAGDTDFVLSGDVDADFSAATSSIDTSNPTASRLLRKGAGAGHGGGAIYPDSTPEYQTLLAWIANGAQP